MLTKQNENENKIKYLFSVYIALNSITVATSNLVVCHQCFVFRIWLKSTKVKLKVSLTQQAPENRQPLDG